MIRNVDIEEITDGKRYGLNDLVRVGCNDCKGCSACCRDMGNSIVLDPYDCYRLTTELGLSMEQLLVNQLALNIVDGMILPNLKMSESTNACSFLNDEGRCSIHHARPGICRIFPLGRLYEEESFSYIHQIYECKKENKTKVKVSKWIDTQNLRENEAFIIEWHSFIKKVQEYLKNSDQETTNRNLNLFVLNLFFMKPYEKGRPFYEQYRERMNQANQILIFE